MRGQFWMVINQCICIGAVSKRSVLPLIPGELVTIDRSQCPYCVFDGDLTRAYVRTERGFYGCVAWRNLRLLEDPDAVTSASQAGA